MPKATFEEVFSDLERQMIAGLGPEYEQYARDLYYFSNSGPFQILSSLGTKCFLQSIKGIYVEALKICLNNINADVYRNDVDYNLRLSKALGVDNVTSD